MSKMRTININSPHIEIQEHSFWTGSFVLALYDGDKVVKVHLERGIIQHLAGLLWDVLREEKKWLCDHIEAMRNEGGEK